MGSLRKLALFGAIALVLPSSAAVAADMAEAVYESQPVTPYEFGSSWYLRGDIGYKMYNTPDAHFDPFDPKGDLIDSSLGNTGLAGFGFGYQVNDWFRTDFTIDYEWPASFHGKLFCPPCGGTKTYSDEYADIAAWTGLVNFYVDFPMGGEGVSGFTPYVGAGIGASDLITSDVHYRNPDGSTGTWKGRDSWNLAWALTLGASYAVSKNWLIDMNYRYVNLGDAVSGNTSYGQPIHYDNIDAHEVRVGFRYMIN